MNTEQIYQYIKRPEQLEIQYLEELYLLVKEYPYFQTAWMLHLKNLHILNDHRFENSLKKAAVHISDRGKLMQYINQGQSSRSRPIAQAPNNEEVKTGQAEMAFIKKRIQELSEKLIALNQQSGTQASGVSWDFEFDPPDNASAATASFSATGYDLESETGKSDMPSDSNSKAQERHKKLLDDFLKSDPKITPGEPHAGIEEDISEYSIRDSDDLFTETLARIYMEQGHYEKALMAYEKLSLKYPEKSIYFANRIKKIEELINTK